MLLHARIQREWHGVRTPLKNTKVMGSLAILVRIPEKITKLPNQHSSWAFNGTTTKRHLNGVSQGGRWWPSAYSDKLKTESGKREKTELETKMDQLLRKLSGSAHVLVDQYDTSSSLYCSNDSTMLKKCLQG